MKCLIIRGEDDLSSETKNGDSVAPLIDPIIPLLISIGAITKKLTLPIRGIKVPNEIGFSLKLIIKFLWLFERIVKRVVGPKGISIVAYMQWRFLLRKSKVEAVFSINPPIELTLALKKLSIPHGEFQHGVAGAKNFLYRISYPDYFFLWDIGSKRLVEREIREYKDSFVIGNLKLRKKIVPSKMKKTSKIVCLFSLQWGLFDVHKYTSCEIDDCLIPTNFIKFMTNNYSTIDFRFRLHPVSITNGEAVGIAKRLLDLKLINSVDALLKYSRQDLAQVLDDVDVHLTLYSSLTIEAAFFGIPTLILDKECGRGGAREDFFSMFLESGMAVVSQSVNFEDEINEIKSGNIERNTSTTKNDDLKQALRTVLERGEKVDI